MCSWDRSDAANIFIWYFKECDSVAGVYSLTMVLVVMASLAITNVSFNPQGADVSALNDEWVEITNTGASVDLDGYVLSDAQGHEYVFRHLVLSKGSSVRVHTGRGVDNATDVFWGRDAPVWNNDGDIVRLSAKGRVLAEKAYGDVPPPSTSHGIYVWGVSLSTIVLIAAIFINSLLRRRGGEEDEDEVDWVQFIERGAEK